MSCSGNPGQRIQCSYLIFGYTESLGVAALHAMSFIYSSDWHIYDNFVSQQKWVHMHETLSGSDLSQVMKAAAERLYGFSSSKRKAVPQRRHSIFLDKFGKDLKKGGSRRCEGYIFTGTEITLGATADGQKLTRATRRFVLLSQLLHRDSWARDIILAYYHHKLPYFTKPCAMEHGTIIVRQWEASIWVCPVTLTIVRQPTSSPRQR